MATAKCSRCHAPYWNYSPRPVPAGYCSQPCFDERKRKSADPRYNDEQAVVGVVSEMRKHYAEVHNTADLTEWFDCRECERLERLKSESLAVSITEDVK